VVAPTASPIALSAALPSAVALPRIQAFLQTLAGPTVLQQAGVVALPHEAPVRDAASRFEALAVPSPMGVTSREASPVREVPRSRAVPTFTREIVAPAPFAAPIATSLPAPAATMFGEVRRVVGDAPSGFAPGRVAQTAELAAHVAETRVARQLGTTPAPTPRSVRWSSDAFTIVVPEPAAAPMISAALAPRPSHAPARDLASTTSFVAPPMREGAAPAPRSVAGVLAFVDDRVGARSSFGARPLPVGAPEVVYVAPAADPLGAPRVEPAPVARRAVPPPTLGLPASFDTAPVAAPPLARAALRSEQIAGEVGLRIGALASEFLVDPHGNVDASVGYAPLLPQTSQRGWLSTEEWVLLSVFPSESTAQEVASSAARRAAVSAELGVLPVVAAASTPSAALIGASPITTTGPRGGLPLTALDAALRTPAAVAPLTAREASGASAPTSTSLAAGAPTVAGPDTSLVAPSVPSSVNPTAAAPFSVAARAMTTQRLPDGRPARGARIVPRVATPLVAPSAFLDGAAPSAVLAGSIAAERRVESPVGAPLWGHLPALVSIAPPEGSAPVESRTDAPRPRPPLEIVAPAPRAQPKVDSARSIALELIAPFVEAARAEPTTAAAGFARPATPVVSGSAPDEATRSLVTALASSQSSGAAAVGDRLTLADLTLISIVSAVDQIAAASSSNLAHTGGDPEPAGAAIGAGGAAVADQSEYEQMAEIVMSIIKRIARNKREDHGEGWEP
jgi:hypothetical protein